MPYVLKSLCAVCLLEELNFTKCGEKIMFEIHHGYELKDEVG